jgi:hypothetical protein
MKSPLIPCPRCGEGMASGTESPCERCRGILARVPPLPAAPLPPETRVQAGWPSAPSTADDPPLRVALPPAGDELAVAVYVLMAVSLVGEIVSALLEITKAIALHRHRTAGVGIETYFDALAYTNVVNLGLMVLFVVALAVCSAWIRVAYSNLTALAVHGLSWSPNEAVGSLFTPWNWPLSPLRVLQETWKASDPNDLSPTDTWRLRSNSALIVAWYICFVLRHVRINIVIIPFPLGNATLVFWLMVAAIASAVAAVLGAVAALFFANLVRTVRQRQHERFARLQD